MSWEMMVFPILFWGNLKLAMIMLIWSQRKGDELEELEEEKLSERGGE